ncbi:MAG: uncharacterized protein QOC94_1769 [Actinoplanes sp.]|jgi:hypothetical protein|nr:uncharacterized protein [Actinoplanes sp.]
MFVGRHTELSLLVKRTDHITRTRTGLAVAVRGRRQVGKSRLVQELCNRSGLPYLYFTAVKGASVTESTAQFLAALSESDLPNRQFKPEIDLVGADRAPVASHIYFCGSLKWLATPFDSHDLHQLQEGARQVPGFDASRTGLLAVTRSGTNLPADAVNVIWSPDDAVAAWQP